MSAVNLIKGLRITTHNTCDAKSKTFASKHLPPCKPSIIELPDGQIQEIHHQWEFLEQKPREWIEDLTHGYTIALGDYTKDDKGIYRRQAKFWNGTLFIGLDADNFKGCKDTDEDALDPWVEEDGLIKKYPSLEKTAFAITQSVNSMQPIQKTDDKKQPLFKADGTPDCIPPHRRYRIFFLFDRKIETEAAYKHLIEVLGHKYPVVAAAKRSPVQPIFGNAREGYNGKRLFCNTESLDEWLAMPSPVKLTTTQPPKPSEPQSKPSEPQTKPASTDNRTTDVYDGPEVSLDEFIEKYNLGYLIDEEYANTSYRKKIRCPWADEHTPDYQQYTGTYIYQPPGEAKGFKCHHTTCDTMNDRSHWHVFREKVAPKKDFVPKKKRKKSKSAVYKDDDVDIGDGIFERFFTKTGRFLPGRMEEAVSEKFNIVYLKTEGELRFHRSGVFMKDDGGEIDKFVKNTLGPDWYDPARVDSTLRALKTEFRVPPPEDDRTLFWHPWEINLKNGIYHIEKREFTPHTPDFKSITQIPVEYNPDAKGPETEKFLRSLLLENQHDIDLVWILLGNAMMQQSELKKICVVYGPTHTGKSTFLDWIEAFIGSKNVSSESLQDLDDADKTYAAAELYGKLVNLSADLSPKLLAGDRIKRLTAGDRVTAQQKYVKAFQFRSYATLFCAANKLPESKDKSSGYLDRLILLPFMNQHLRNFNPNQLKLLKAPEEMSYSLNRALEGMHKFLDNGSQVPETETIQISMSEYQRKNNPILDFLDAGYRRHVKNAIKESALWESFKSFCEDEGLYLPTKKQFREFLVEWGTERKRGQDGSSRYFYYKGIAEGPEPIPEASPPNVEKESEGTDTDLIDEIKF